MIEEELRAHLGHLARVMAGPMVPFVYVGRLFYNDGPEAYMLGFVDVAERPKGDEETTSPSMPFDADAILTFDCFEDGCNAATGKGWRSPTLDRKVDEAQ